MKEKKILIFLDNFENSKINIKNLADILILYTIIKLFFSGFIE